MSSKPSNITVKVEDPAFRDGQLEQATALIREQAAGCGILVTRINHTTFTVGLSPDVKFGLTKEIDLLSDSEEQVSNQTSSENTHA